MLLQQNLDLLNNKAFATLWRRNVNKKRDLNIYLLQ